MKLYPVTFELYDDGANDHIATFKAFDDESLIIELKQEIWCVDDLRKLADAYEEATKQLANGVFI